jgi:hypothetical protein
MFVERATETECERNVPECVFSVNIICPLDFILPL